MHPVMFYMGTRPVYSYTIMAMAGILAMIVVGYLWIRPRGYTLTQVLALTLAGCVAGLIGARLFFVIGNMNEFVLNPGEIFQPQMAGLVFYGAVIFGGAAVLRLAKAMKMKVWQVADAGIVAMFIGLAIGRVGCFLNGCCAGKSSGLPWAVTFPGSITAVHPTQIYEIILCLVAFGALVYISRYLQRDGQLFFLGLAFYAGIRFFVEFFRVHSDPIAGDVFQLISLVILLICVVVLTWGYTRLPLKETASTSEPVTSELNTQNA